MFQIFCSSNDNPNGAVGGGSLPRRRRGQRRALLRPAQLRRAVEHEFKLAGNYPLPLGFDLRGHSPSSRRSRARHHLDARGESVSWWPHQLGVTHPHRAGGALYYPRYNQLDLNVKKTFRVGRKTFTGQMDFFNALNGNTIIATNNAIGANLGFVNEIQIGRLPRIVFQMKF